jgi:hypothetical protein
MNAAFIRRLRLKYRFMRLNADKFNYHKYVLFLVVLAPVPAAWRLMVAMPGF